MQPLYPFTSMGEDVAPSPDFFAPPMQQQWQPLDIRIEPEPKKREIDHAKKEVPRMLKASAEYMQRKRPWLVLWRRLYDNKLELNQWKPNIDDRQMRKVWDILRGIRRNIDEASGNTVSKWRTNFTVACAPFCDSYAESYIQAVFAQEDFCQVKPGPRNSTGSIEDSQFPTARKIQSKLIDSFNQMGIRGDVHQCALDDIRYGTVAAKLVWYEDTRLEAGIDEYGQPDWREQVVRHGTELKSLDLLKFLPDPEGKGPDCQKWRFVGDRSDVDWEVIASKFSTTRQPGPYNVGRKEFFEKWPDQGSVGMRNEGRALREDPDVDSQMQYGKGQLQVWEMHGKLSFPGDDRPTECVCTYVTDVNTDDPSGGVLVRLQLQSALKSGTRPYAVDHFIPTGGPLGRGLIEQNQDIIWLYSHVQNTFIDACRLMAIPMIKAREGSLYTRKTKDEPEGLEVFPGMIVKFQGDPNEVQPMWLQADLSSIMTLMNFLEGQLEKRTSISATTRGVQDKTQTATEFAGLIQQSLRPINTKLSMFKERILDPLARTAVTYLQTFVFEDQEIFVTDDNGQPIPATLSVDELRTGEYRVFFVLDLPDQTKISKAQTIMQLLPILTQIALPLLQYEKKRIKFAGLIEALLRCLDISETTNVIETVDDLTQMQILNSMMPPGQPGQPQPGQEGQGQLMPGTDGGPLGPDQNMINELMQRTQYDAQGSSPVPVGQRLAAA